MDGGKSNYSVQITADIKACIDSGSLSLLFVKELKRYQFSNIRNPLSHLGECIPSNILCWIPTVLVRARALG